MSSNTKFTFLDTHDNYGKYINILNKDEKGNNISENVSDDLYNEVVNSLPEGKTVTTIHPDWIRKSDLITTAACEIKLTYLNEGAGYKNGLSYYIYDLDNPPTKFSDVSDIYIIFPNTSKTGSGGTMNKGDTLKLAYEVLSYTSENNKRFATSLNYVFPPNKGISFVVHANRWKNNGTQNAFLSVGHLMYSSDPILNPEPTLKLKNHFVNFESTVEPGKIIYGIEDILRNRSWCDHDFNDVTFYVTPSPITAISPVSYNSSSKQVFSGTILCEDLKDRINADLDYNDFTLEYEVTENLSADKITSIVIKIKALGRGATLDHDFGVVIPKIKNIEGVKIIREEYITHSDTTNIYHETDNILTGGTDRVPIVKSTSNFLPPDSSWSTNTKTHKSVVIPSYAILRIIFPSGGISRDVINSRYFPYNFYLRVYRGTRHMWDLYSDNDYGDITTELKNLGIASKKKIFILEDVLDFRHPIEKQPLRKVFRKFENFLLGDMRYKSWHLTKWAMEHLLYPKIEHTDTHSWNSVLDKNKLPINNNMLILSHDDTLSWDSKNIQVTLNSHKFTETDLLDWSDIDNNNIEDIISFIRDFGNLLVIKNGSYSNNSEFYYISLTSIQTNIHRIVESEKVGLTDTIELGSSTTISNPYFIVKTH